MANTLLINTQTVRELDPGAKGSYHWNNASPTDAVWTANAVPRLESTSESHEVALEVTRLWRKVIFTKTGLAAGAGSVESEIHYEVKNVGARKTKFVVYLAVTS